MSRSYSERFGLFLVVNEGAFASTSGTPSAATSRLSLSIGCSGLHGAATAGEGEKICPRRGKTEPTGPNERVG